MKRLILIVMLLCSLVHWAQDITKVEYAFDFDNGFGSNNITNVTAGLDINPSLSVSIPANTAIGFHKLYLRAKNANGWSHTVRKNIEIIPVSVANNVITGEYFIDDDPEFNQGIAFTITPQSTNITQDILVQLTSNLSIGFHKLYFRLKDQAGKWSHTLRYNIEVIESISTINIVAAEFFFNTDPIFGNATSIIVVADNPNSDGTWTFNIPYPVGPYNFTDKLFLRTKDQTGNWSHTTILDAIDPSLSTNVYNQGPLRIYPNPTTDFVIIHSAQNQTFEITIYDALGKIITQQTAENKTKIDLRSVPVGLYFIQAIDENNNTSTYKIIKQ